MEFVGGWTCVRAEGAASLGTGGWSTVYLGCSTGSSVSRLGKGCTSSSEESAILGNLYVQQCRMGM